MTVLITGKTGTVGSNIDWGVGYSSKQYNLLKYNDACRMIYDTKPNAIIHAAAIVGGLKMHIEHQYELFYNNLMINTNVIEAARKCEIPRVLSLLSSCIFSDRSVPPYTESMVHDYEPFDIHHAYGHVKRMLEVQNRICYERLGLTYNCVIPTNIYGINDDFNFDRGHVIGVLIHKAYLAARDNTEFVVWGDGKQQREFLFTNDVSKILKWVVEEYKDKEPLILSNNVLVSIGEIAEIIAHRFNLQIKYDTSQPFGQKVRSLSGNKLARLYPMTFTPIDKGINQTIDWFIKNYENART